MKQATVVIPSLNPDARLPELARALAAAGVERLIIVNDGSSAACRKIFDEAAAEPGVRLLAHPVNHGKGAALKTAIRYELETNPESPGIVTADADGQHSVPDILAVMRELAANPGELVLGAREFSGDDVPFKSRFGNRLTSGVFLLAAGRKIRDTQTGLRGIPAVFFRRCLKIRGNRFEFETEMLLAAGQCGIPFQELPIKTIYCEMNRGTHFHPIKDAARIYRVIFRYSLPQFGAFLLTSASSAAIDLGVFALLFYRLRPERLMAAVVTARVVSSLGNYLMNRFWVFRGQPNRLKNWRDTAAGYYCLCLALMAASYGFTRLGEKFFPETNLVIVKAAVDFLLFLLSFLLQKLLVFRRRQQISPR